MSEFLTEGITPCVVVYMGASMQGGKFRRLLCYHLGEILFDLFNFFPDAGVRLNE